MVAIDVDNRLSFITQPRPAMGGDIWEFPAGCLDPKEPPFEAAKRELEEEVGVTADEWFELGSICTAPGFCDEVLQSFCCKTTHRNSNQF